MKAREWELDPFERWTLLFILAAVALTLLVSCQAGPISGAALGAIAALDQMMANGTITPEQYQALRGSLGGFSLPEVLGTVAGVVVPGAIGAIGVRNSAVKRVMQLRGPTESQRRASKGAS